MKNKLKTDFHKFLVKKIIVLFVTILATVFLFAEPFENDAYDYGQLYSTYVSGFYPGVITQADSFLTRYPQSLYADDVMIHKAVSFFYLGRYSSSIEVLNQMLEQRQVSVSPEKLIEATFWKGRCLYGQQKYMESYRALFNATQLIVSTEKSYLHPLYEDCLFYAAIAAYDSDLLQNAQKPLEYLVTRPTVLAQKESRFYTVCGLLFSIYQRLGFFQESINLYQQLVLNDFPISTAGLIHLAAAEAYTNLNKTSIALKLYTDLFSFNDSLVAVTALQKAYVLASETIPPIPGYFNYEIVDKAALVFGSDSPLLAEFRIRLGIEAFDVGNFYDASMYFDDAEAFLQSDFQNNSELIYLNQLLPLYRSAIIAYDAEDFTEEKAAVSRENASKALELIQSHILESPENISENQYYPWLIVSAIKYAALCDDFFTVDNLFKDFLSIATSDDSKIPYQELFDVSRYWYAFSIFKQGYFSQVVDILSGTDDLFLLKPFSSDEGSSDSIAENDKNNEADKQIITISSFVQKDDKNLDISSSVLYAQSLMLCGKTDEAMALFESLEDSTIENTDFAQNVRLNYAKASMLSKQYKFAFNLMSEFSFLLDDSEDKYVNDEKQYVAGLSAFNVGDWEKSDVLLSNYSSNSKNKWASWALYYSAVAKYQMGKLEDAYTSFEIFLKANKNHPLFWDACMSSARCSLQIFQLSKQPTLRTSVIHLARAKERAKDAADNAKNDKERGLTSQLRASISSDLKEYDDAIAFLKPYAIENSQFGLACQFQLAEVFAKKGDVNQSDAAFEDVQMRFPDTILAENALFRRGEIRFDNKEWEKATLLFTKYRRSYTAGTFSDAAVFMNAASLSEKQQVDQAILLYQELIRAYPESTYIYSSLVNLAKLYRVKGEYGSAMDSIILLKNKYGNQTDTADISKMAAEIKLLLEGLEEQTAVSLAAFNAADRETTPNGRRIGVDLAKLYLTSPVSKNYAETLLLKLIPGMIKNIDTERDILAMASKMLGSYYREQNQYLTAAKYYLDGAEYFATVDSESAAQCLYGAIDSFDYAGAFSDAKSTFALLRSTYGSSVWTTRAAVIIEGEK